MMPLKNLVDTKSPTTMYKQKPKLVSHSYQTTKDKMKPPTHTKICEMLKPNISSRNQKHKNHESKRDIKIMNLEYLFLACTKQMTYTRKNVRAKPQT